MGFAEEAEQAEQAVVARRRGDGDSRETNPEYNNCISDVHEMERALRTRRHSDQIQPIALRQ